MIAFAAACESPPADRAPLTVVLASPVDGDRDVPTTIHPTVTFNKPLDPWYVGSGLLTMRSGGLRPGGRLRYSLVDRTARFVPSVTLRTGLAYAVVLDPAVRGIDGGALEEPFEAVFVTGETGTENPPEPPTPEFAGEVEPLLRARCGTCHAGPSAPLGLALLPATETTAAVARDSVQWIGWRLVDPGSPERSYLMYKVVASPGLLGTMMPPEEMLPVEERRTLERWIAGGADTEVE